VPIAPGSAIQRPAGLAGGAVLEAVYADHVDGRHKVVSQQIEHALNRQIPSLPSATASGSPNRRYSLCVPKAHPSHATRRYSLTRPLTRVCLRTRYCARSTGSGSGFSGTAPCRERCGCGCRKCRHLTNRRVLVDRAAEPVASSGAHVVAGGLEMGPAVGWLLAEGPVRPAGVVVIDVSAERVVSDGEVHARSTGGTRQVSHRSAEDGRSAPPGGATGSSVAGRCILRVVRGTGRRRLLPGGGTPLAAPPRAPWHNDHRVCSAFARLPGTVALVDPGDWPGDCI